MIELVPAIDIIEGSCVRLSQGKYDSKTVYSPDPLEVAQRFEDMGIRRLHLVDLDGARAGRVVNIEILRMISLKTSLLIDFGGGVKTDGDIGRVFDAGADMVTAGSIAVKDPVLVEGWLEEYGHERIILGADVRKGRIAIHGWQEDTSLEIMEFIRSYREKGARKVICTDIDQDGMLSGPSLDLYSALKGSFPDLEIIASGGVSGMKDIRELDGRGIDGVIFGKAFYEGSIREDEITEYLNSN